MGADFQCLLEALEPGAVLTGICRMRGGTSGPTTVLDYDAGGRRHRVVVREYLDTPDRNGEQTALHMRQLLNLLRGLEIRVPTPYRSGDDCTRGTNPYLVMEFVDGQPMNAATGVTDRLIAAEQMAAVLAGIHRATRPPDRFSFLPMQADHVAARLARVPEQPDESLSEGRVRRALERLWPPPTENPSVLLHGDFWPGNILWADRQIAAILDWEDAAIGDPLSDLANARLEVFMHFGRPALDRFTNHYRALSSKLNYENLPRWDLYAALRPAGKMVDFGLDAATYRTFVRRHQQFVDQAWRASGLSEGPSTGGRKRAKAAVSGQRAHPEHRL